MKENMKKIAKKFGGMKIKPYLCTRIREINASATRLGSLGEWLKPAVC